MKYKTGLKSLSHHAFWMSLLGLTSEPEDAEGLQLNVGNHGLKTSLSQLITICTWI